MEDLDKTGQLAARISEFVITEAARLQALPEAKRKIDRKKIKEIFDAANEPLPKDMTKKAEDYVWLTHLRRLHERLAIEASEQKDLKF